MLRPPRTGPELPLIGRAPFDDLGVVGIEDRELRHAQCKLDLGIIRLEHQRVLVAFDRLAPAVHDAQRIAAAVTGLGIVRLERERAVETRQRTPRAG